MKPNSPVIALQNGSFSGVLSHIQLSVGDKQVMLYVMPDLFLLDQKRWAMATSVVDLPWGVTLAEPTRPEMSIFEP